MVIETSPSRAIGTDITTNVYGRCSAARTRNVTAAQDHEMPAAHSRDTSCPCFEEPGAIPDTSTSHQCNLGAIPRGLKNALRLAKFQHIDSYASI